MAMGSPASPRNVGAVQPPRAARLLHTRRILSKPSRLPPSALYCRPSLSLSFSLILRSSFPRPRAPSSPSSRLPLVGITLFAFPAAGRRVARCLARAYTLLAPCMHISIVYSSSLAYPSLPAMHTALQLPPIALFSSLARDDRIRRITTCVFSTSRGEPPLASANARADFGVALIALGVKCGMRGFSSSNRRYLSPVCFASLAVTGDKRFPFPPSPPPLAISHISRAYIKDEGGAFRIKPRDISV